MPYDVTMVQLDASAVGGWGSGLTPAASMGFPAGDFSTVLYSQWMCSAGSLVGPSGISPRFSAGANAFVSVGPAIGTLTLGNISGQFFSGSFARFSAGLRTHLLLSVNVQTRTIQLYFNDQPVVVTGTWTGALGSNWFNIGTGVSTYQWNGENSAITNPPAVADIWCGTSVSDTFVDLTTRANRRKFINADLTPVYLGADGSTPFGYVPQIFSTVQAGGVANDMLTNRGAGVDFALGPSIALSLQESGICVLPPPPPEPLRLALDNLLVTGDLRPHGDQIFLMWSDDRGHTYGSPVGQLIGARGAYLTSISWNRLGYARDRVFKLEWSVPVATALQGAWIDADTKAKS